MAVDIDNVCIGGATADIGVDLGYIKDAITATRTVEQYTVDGIEQLLTPAKAFNVSESWEVSLTLVEGLLTHLSIAWDQTDTTSPFVLGDNKWAPTNRELEITGVNPAGFVRTVVWYNVVVVGSVEVKFTKTEEQSYPITFNCMYDDAVEDQVGLLTDAIS